MSRGLYTGWECPQCGGLETCPEGQATHWCFGSKKPDGCHSCAALREQLDQQYQINLDVMRERDEARAELAALRAAIHTEEARKP